MKLKILPLLRKIGSNIGSSKVILVDEKYIYHCQYHCQSLCKSDKFVEFEMSNVNQNRRFYCHIFQELAVILAAVIIFPSNIEINDFANHSSIKIGIGMDWLWLLQY